MSLTDHFSVPFDPEAELNAVYDLEIRPDGRVAGGAKLEPGRWYQLALDWAPRQRECFVSIDGRRIAALPQLKLTDSGINYLRFHATSEDPDDGGLLVGSVSASVVGAPAPPEPRR